MPSALSERVAGAGRHGYSRFQPGLKRRFDEFEGDNGRRHEQNKALNELPHCFVSVCCVLHVAFVFRFACSCNIKAALMTRE